MLSQGRRVDSTDKRIGPNTKDQAAHSRLHDVSAGVSCDRVMFVLCRPHPRPCAQSVLHLSDSTTRRSQQLFSSMPVSARYLGELPWREQQRDFWKEEQMLMLVHPSALAVQSTSKANLTQCRLSRTLKSAHASVHTLGRSDGFQVLGMRSSILSETRKVLHTDFNTFPPRKDRNPTSLLRLCVLDASIDEDGALRAHRPRNAPNLQCITSEGTPSRRRRIAIEDEQPLSDRKRSATFDVRRSKHGMPGRVHVFCLVRSPFCFQKCVARSSM